MQSACKYKIFSKFPFRNANFMLLTPTASPALVLSTLLIPKNLAIELSAQLPETAFGLTSPRPAVVPAMFSPP